MNFAKYRKNSNELSDIDNDDDIIDLTLSPTSFKKQNELRIIKNVSEKPSLFVDFTENEDLPSSSKVNSSFSTPEEKRQKISRSLDVQDCSPNKKSKLNDDEKEKRKENECVICLDTLKDMTAASCGHVFCYNCIVDWAKTKSICPICRKKIVKSRLVRLFL